MPLLIGTVSPPNESGQMPNDYVLMYRFQAAASGQIIRIKVKVGESGTVKVAIYADNSGEPGSLLNAVNTAAAVTADTEAVIPIAGTSVTNGTYYWLAVAVAAGQRYYFTNTSAGTRRYKTITYSGYSFPNPAGSGYSADSYDAYIAGESDTVITSGDNGGGSEASALLEKEILSAETGLGVDTGGIVVNKASGDTGGGNESGGLMKSLSCSDEVCGHDAFSVLIRKAGSDMKLPGNRGDIGISHKEIDL